VLPGGRNYFINEVDAHVPVNGEPGDEGGMAEKAKLERKVGAKAEGGSNDGPTQKELKI